MRSCERSATATARTRPPPGAALEARAAALDLDPRRAYVVLRARTHALETEQLRRTLLRTQQTVGSKL